MLEHGGNLHDAMRQFGRTRNDWLDLSTGVNPHGYPAPPLPADAWQRLPDDNEELTHVACRYYSAPQLLPVAGSQMAIQALPRLRPPSRVVVAAPSYAEHAHHWRQQGHTLREVSYAQLATAVGDCDVLVVCNPNNPTGERIAPATLLAWAGELAARGGWLVVDEAFADMTPATSVASWCNQPGLIVLRSIGKFFGLAGLRLGFVGAHTTLLRTLADALGPWTISGPAQQIGIAALRDAVWQQAMREHLRSAGQRLHTLLRENGLNGTGSDLFQWWPDAQADAFWRHMAERGVWVRRFPQAARGIRLGLPGEEAGWARLSLALQEWKQREQA